MRFLVTGATGHLGMVLVQRLVEAGYQIRALVLSDDQLFKHLPIEVQTVKGDITDPLSIQLFLHGWEDATVIHCAGLISLRWRKDKQVEKINVGGTKNIVDACVSNNMRLIYISSVHALPEAPRGEQIKEQTGFSAKLVTGGYAKTKAEASKLVIDAIVNEGLNACMVFPSGIIGPGGYQLSSQEAMLAQYASGKLSVGVQGGYSFVDVRDLVDGLYRLATDQKFRGQYLIPGRYVTIREFFEAIDKAIDRKRKKPVPILPTFLAYFALPYYFIKDKISRKKPVVTRYSIYTLNSNSNFSNEKAERVLGQTYRSFEETIKDTIQWLKKIDKLN